MVIGHLRIIDKTAAGADWLFENGCCTGTVRAELDRPQPLLQGGNHILCKITGICSRIGQHLVILVKALQDIQSLFRGISEPLAGLPLRRRQVIQAWRRHNLFPARDLRDLQGGRDAARAGISA